MSETPATDLPGSPPRASQQVRRLALDVDLDPAATTDDRVDADDSRREAASRDRALLEDVPPHHG